MSFDIDKKLKELLKTNSKSTFTAPVKSLARPNKISSSFFQLNNNSTFDKLFDKSKIKSIKFNMLEQTFKPFTQKTLKRRGYRRPEFYQKDRTQSYIPNPEREYPTGDRMDSESLGRILAAKRRQKEREEEFYRECAEDINKQFPVSEEAEEEYQKQVEELQQKKAGYRYKQANKLLNNKKQVKTKQQDKLSFSQLFKPRKLKQWNVEAAEQEGHHIEYMSPAEYLERTAYDINNPVHTKYLTKYYDIETLETEPIEKLKGYIESEHKQVHIPERKIRPEQEEVDTAFRQTMKQNVINPFVTRRFKQWAGRDEHKQLHNINEIEFVRAVERGEKPLASADIEIYNKENLQTTLPYVDTNILGYDIHNNPIIERIYYGEGQCENALKVKRLLEWRKEQKDKGINVYYDINYHKKLGKLYGYTDPEINAFINIIEQDKLKRNNNE